MGIRAALAGPR